MKAPKFPVIYQRKEYVGIRKFNCHVIHLYTEETRQGSFFTTIPISDAGFRAQSPTEARVVIKKEKDWTIFEVYSDYGSQYVMKIHNSLSKEIETARQTAIEQELLQEANS